MRGSWLRRLLPARGRRPDPAFHEVERRTRELELSAHGIVGGLPPGTWTSLFRGSGVEPDGVRPYQAGDGIRFVDWRVTAKKGRLHVREFTDERGTDVLLVLDRSPVLMAGPGQAASMALETTAALAMASARAGNPLGLMQVTDGVNHYLPPRPDTLQLRRVLRSLAFPPEGGVRGDLAQGLGTARRVLPTASLVVVVSDFRVEDQRRAELESALASLAAGGWVMLVRVAVPTLLDLPSVGVVTVRDPGSGRRITYDTGSERERTAVAAREEELRSWWRQLAELAGGRSFTLDPARPLAPQLHAALTPSSRWAA